jgi:hypothetical protein
MQSKNLHRLIIGLLAVVLTFPLLSSCVESLRDIREEITSRQLEGRWYVNGDRGKAAEIYSTRGGLEAKNERGDTTPIEYDSRGAIRATNWEGGLRGDVRRNTIRWANGTTWER